jgi:hypothetical protein
MSKSKTSKLFKIKLNLYISKYEYDSEEEREFDEQLRKMKKSPIEELMYENNKYKNLLSEDDTQEYSIDEFMMKNNKYKDVAYFISDYNLEGKLILSNYEDEILTFVVSFDVKKTEEDVEIALLNAKLAGEILNYKESSVVVIPDKTNPLKPYGDIDFRMDEYIEVELL